MGGEDAPGAKRFGCRTGNDAGARNHAPLLLLLAGILILCLLLSSPAAAHVPLTPGGNTHIDDAFSVADPTKSWVIYGALSGGGDVRYYRMEMDAGDELRLSLFTPEGTASFVPGLVVIGPDTEATGVLPPSVEMPHQDDEHRRQEEMHDTGGNTAAYGAVVIEGTRPAAAEFEPFTPSALYPTADHSQKVTQPGIWYVAVYAPEASASGGNFGLAVGYREEFTLAEWLLVPFSVLGIHRWEGQSWVLILGPLAAVLGAGFGLIFRQRRRNKPNGLPINGPFGWLAATAGLLFLGTGMMLLVQTGMALTKTGMTAAVILPVVYITAAFLLGAVSLRAGLRSRGWGLKNDGVLMIVVGIVALVVWAGLIAGPVCAMAAGAGALLLGEKRVE